MSAWRDAVREELAVYREQTGEDVVRLGTVYDLMHPRVRGQFPHNNHPEAKIRQTLQHLRDRGELRFLENGRYDIRQLDHTVAAPDSEASVAWSDPHEETTERTRTADTVQKTLTTATSSEPGRSQRVVDQILRDESLVTELKEQYDSTCQLCGTHRLQAPETRYAECHHLRPLGTPHDGPDTLPNMLVLCPNHHVDFDYGMVRVDPRSFTIEHAYDDDIHTELELQHELDHEYLAYHDSTIAVI